MTDDQIKELPDNRPQAWYDGAVAFARGVPMEHNPYGDEQTNWSARQWYVGWCAGQDKAREKAERRARSALQGNEEREGD